MPADGSARHVPVLGRAAIEALMWRYVRALDTLDPEAYAGVFTEDGTFGSGSQQRKGRAFTDRNTRAVACEWPGRLRTQQFQ